MINKSAKSVLFEINLLQDTKKYYNLPGILLIEDNVELREYLAGHFDKKYKVHIAEDGLTGLKLAKEPKISFAKVG
jgi:hypothetical protein